MVVTLTSKDDDPALRRHLPLPAIEPRLGNEARSVRHELGEIIKAMDDSKVVGRMMMWDGRVIES